MTALDCPNWCLLYLSTAEQFAAVTVRICNKHGFAFCFGLCSGWQGIINFVRLQALLIAAWLALLMHVSKHWVSVSLHCICVCFGGDVLRYLPHAFDDDDGACAAFSARSSLWVLRIMRTCNRSSSVMSLALFLSRLCVRLVFLTSFAIRCRSALASSCCFLKSLIFAVSVSASSTVSTLFHRRSSSGHDARPL